MTKPILNIEKATNLEGCTLTYGHFNLVHPGHIRYLKHASMIGVKTVVAIISDTHKGKSRNYQFNQQERAEGLASFNFIDTIILLKDEETALLKAIKILNPNYLVLGTEFENTTDKDIIKAISYIKKLGKGIQFHAGEIQYATTQLLDNSKNYLLEENKKKFRDACLRQDLKLKNLIDHIDSWSDTELLVIGDTILDQYAGCEAIGMSAEAPVLVVKELQKKNFLGGASIVASHIAALGAKCHFLSVVGDDYNSGIIEEKLKKQNINCFLVKDLSRPTTFKKRYVVENQKLFRVSRLNDHLLSKEIENKLIEKLKEIAPNIKGIVISDFVYGVITNKVIEVVLSLAKKYKLKIFGDLQCSSQIGLITKFKNFSLLCPNEKEARIALQDKDSGLEILSNKLILNTKCKKLIMKLGAEGFIAYDSISEYSSKSQSFPALSVNPVDVSGAGDSLLAVMSTSLSTEDNFMSAAAIACCMTAIAVENMGNRPIYSDTLKKFLSKIFHY